MQDQYLYQRELRPHRSLTGRNFRRMMIVIGLLTGFASLRFLAVGAWPVVIFVAVDIFAVWFAFMLSYRSGKAREIVTLTETTLTIERIGPDGPMGSWDLEPYWAVAKLEHVDGEDNQLTLRSNKDKLVLGTFLGVEDRRDFCEEITDRLQLWRAGNLEPQTA